jgi:hypothetical protein
MVIIPATKEAKVRRIAVRCWPQVKSKIFCFKK